jgi:hypothetical protein
MYGHYVSTYSVLSASCTKILLHNERGSQLELVVGELAKKLVDTKSMALVPQGGAVPCPFHKVLVSDDTKYILKE